MEYLTTKAPIGCKVVGRMYHTDDPTHRGEDMVEVQMPNGVLVYAGWWREGQVDGSYRVCVTKGFKYLQQVFVSDVHKANQLVERFAVEYL